MKRKLIEECIILAPEPSCKNIAIGEFYSVRHNHIEMKRSDVIQSYVLKKQTMRSRAEFAKANSARDPNSSRIA